MGRVIVVGSVNVDLVVRGERLPAPGETVVGGTFGRFHGGKGGNQAVAAARLGAEVAFVGAVGDDAFGDDALEALRREGIDATHVERLPGVPTGVALILVDARGENIISVASGANGRSTEAGVAAAFGRLRPGVGDVVLAGHEIPTATALAALRLARTAGATTILNPAPVGGLTPALLGSVDLLTPNRGELAALAGATDTAPDAAARTMIASGVGAVLVSLGAAGALLVEPERPAVSLPAPGVEAVDATGAGDTLNGAVAAGLAEGRPLADAARRAVAAASLSVTRAGARDGMPTAEELATFLGRARTGTG